MKKIGFTLIFYLVVMSVAGQTDAANTGRRVDSLLNDAYSKFPTGSISVGIVNRDSLIWKKSYGWADMERKIPANPNTIYRIGSITKQFTAVMLLRLVENGNVHFSDPVEKYIREFEKVEKINPSSQSISLVQLANHTAGLPREPQNESLYTTQISGEWDKTLLSSFKDIKMRNEPGVKYSYSNVGYAVLGLALSKAARTPYTNYIIDSVTKPLSMNSTFFNIPSNSVALLAKGYHYVQGVLDTATSKRELAGRGYRVPNGGLYSSINDLAVFTSFLMGEHNCPVLKKQTIVENYTRIVVTNAKFTSAYGIGYIIERAPEITIFGHGGTVIGYDSLIAFDNAQKVGVIILHNVTGDKFNSFELAKQILLLYK